MPKTPDDQMQAHLAYQAWVQRQDREDLPLWAELSSTEQDAWRRAVRLLAVLGLDED